MLPRYYALLCLLSLSSCCTARIEFRQQLALPMQGPAGGGDGVTPAGASRRPPVALRKRGVGWGLNASQVQALEGLAWWYNWGPGPQDDEAAKAAAAAGMSFAPMQVCLPCGQAGSATVIAGLSLPVAAPTPSCGSRPMHR